MRAAYAWRLKAITGAAKQLTMTFEYDQNAMNGPLFPVPAEEVRGRYGAAFAMVVAKSGAIEGDLKGQVVAVQTVWVMG